MPDNPWLAIDAATTPSERAREVRAAWESFLDEGQIDAVRMPIAHSWQRCYAAGVNPSDDHGAPTVADRDEASSLWHVHPLAAAAPLISQCLSPVAAGTGHLIVVSDADGLLLW